MKTLFLIPVLLTGLLGCDSAPLKTVPTSNSNFKVDFLFENEGCRVYRFVDADENIYYTHCGVQIQTSWDRSCGKGCVEHLVVSGDDSGS
jgi:hypothetical protein